MLIGFENPFRIVLDLRKGAASGPGTPQPYVAKAGRITLGIHTIVIDPGHGGKEVGAIGPAGLMEKDATLMLCRRLAAALEAKLKTRVILTRNDDTVVPLDQRTAIANQYHADLFLSVHMNAAIVKGYGAETYFLSLDASDKLAEKAAEVENASKNSAAPASSSDLKLMLWDLRSKEYLNESNRLAQAVQEEMNRITGIQSRGVKQAPFKVLVGATMPAALVEVAFITNPDEELKIKSDTFQATVVDALTKAVERYKIDYETRIGIPQPPPQPAAAPTTTAPTAPTPTTTAATTRTGRSAPGGGAVAGDSGNCGRMSEEGAHAEPERREQSRRPSRDAFLRRAGDAPRARDAQRGAAGEPAGALSVVARELIKGSANAGVPPIFPRDTVVVGAFLLPDGTAFVDPAGTPCRRDGARAVMRS